MSKTLKTITRIIALVLTACMVLEISPINTIAAYVTNINEQSNSLAIESQYDESYNFYYNSHSMNAGRAGTLRVNDYTLRPSLNFDSLGIDGNIYPVNIEMQYNSSVYRFVNEVTDYTATAYGMNWSTNYNSMLCELQYEDKTQIAYLAGSGSVLLFEQAEFDDTDMDMDFPDGTTKWVPVSENYDGYVIYKVTAEYAMTEDMQMDGRPMQYALMENGTWMHMFDICGRFSYSMNMENDAQMSVSYLTDGSTMPEAIAKITDGVGNEYRFTYTDGLLTKIKCYTADGTAIIAGDGEDAAPLEMSFAYTNGNLTSVTFPDGQSVSYTYNSLGDLTTVTNIDGYKIELSYTNGIVSGIAEYALDENNIYIAGNSLTVTWNGNTRTFEDNNGNKQIKTYDENGKIVRIVDGDGNILYGVADEEESTGTAEEDTTGMIPEEETTEVPFVSLCPCADCPEWECSCECENEEVCTCIQCKRSYRTVEDESGNVLAEESFDGEKTMRTQNTYTSDGNHLASSIDTSGNIVYYVYDEAGFLDSMSSGDMEVLFDYDAMGNLTQLSQSVSGLSGGNTMSNQYTYTDDKIMSITHNGFSYNFTYDEWGNQTAVKINDRTLVAYAYDETETNRLTEITYANGQSVGYAYDDNGNIISITYNDEEESAFAFEYDENGTLTKITDNNAGYVTTYSENGTEMRTLDGDILLYSSVYNDDGTQTETVYGSAITYTYNSDYNQVTGKTVSEKSFSTRAYSIEDESLVSEIACDVTLTDTSDWFGRTESKQITVNSVITDMESEETSEYHVSGEYGYTYDDTDDTASTKILSHSAHFTAEDYSYSRTDHYEYDETGNITGIFRYDDGVKNYYYTYTYDEAGQLVREDIREDDKTIVYVYDIGGNIVSKTEYTYTLGEITEEMTPVEESHYTYGDSEWKDLLTAFSFSDSKASSNNIDTQLTYDAMGNVTSFNGTTYTWTAGRQLESSAEENGKTVRYYYNEDGNFSRADIYRGEELRERYVYLWDGDRLISRSIVDPETNAAISSRIIYDADGEALGFTFGGNINGTEATYGTYLYRKNLQGDITGIFGVNGQLLAELTYDAYGNVELHPISNNLGGAIAAALVMVLSPILYRGYTYVPFGDDINYYLGSRFYCPKLGRFLNADKHTDTGTGVVGTNMFAYCNNNPVMFFDPTGEAINLSNYSQLLVNFINIIKQIIRAGMAYSISAKGVLMAPGATYIQTMENKNISFSYVDEYELYYVLTVLWTQKWNKYEKYTIETVSTTVKNWWRIIDKVDYYVKIYNYTTIAQSVGSFVYSAADLGAILAQYSITLPAFFSTISKIAVAVNIPVALVMMTIGNSFSKIGTAIRGMNQNERYTFNWSVTRDFWTIGMPETEHTTIHTAFQFI